MKITITPVRPGQALLSFNRDEFSGIFGKRNRFRIEAGCGGGFSLIPDDSGEFKSINQTMIWVPASRIGCVQSTEVKVQSDCSFTIWGDSIYIVVPPMINSVLLDRDETVLNVKVWTRNDKIPPSASKIRFRDHVIARIWAKAKDFLKKET